MSARMQFPLSQRRHTNIAVVRYTKNGIKLEIACYKNKVVSYRGGTEDRMDEVLQVERVFTNVARGHVASEKDIHAVFGNNMSEEEAIIFILKHGELQVAQQERTAEVDELFKDIAMIISQKCINTETQRPFPVQVVETALRSVGAAVKLDQPVKKQALALIHQLIESNVIPISRANMKLRCVVPNAAVLREVEVWCVEHGADAQPNNNNGDDDQQALLICMQPHLFRELEAFVRADLPAGCQLHTLETAVMEVESSSPVSGSTINLMSEDARSVAKSKASKTSTKNTNNNMAEEMDDEEDDEKGGKRGKKGANNRRKQPQDLAAALQVSDDDDDDDGKRKKGGRKAKQAKKAVAAPTKPAEPEEVDSDEELAGNRRQRKKQVAPAHEHQNDDEEDFDYGEED